MSCCRPFRVTLSTTGGASRSADYGERFALIIAWVVVIVVFSILAPQSFFNVQNFTTMFGTQTTLVILALALLIPLTAGDYDLSVAATLTMAGMLVAVLNAQHGVPLGLTILIALAFGACSVSSTGSSSSSSTSTRSS